MKGDVLHEKFAEFSNEILNNEKFEETERKRLNSVLKHMEK